MAHKNWCGFSCSDCPSGCALDEIIPCSPDCEGLNADGSINADICKSSGCDSYKL